MDKRGWLSEGICDLTGPAHRALMGEKEFYKMPVDTAPRSTTWTFVDGEWVSGNPPLIGPTSHAMWLGSTVFDGARWFDGIAPDLDLHCQRVNRSAEALGLKAVVTAEEAMAAVLGRRQEVRRQDGDLHQAHVLGRAWLVQRGCAGCGIDPFCALPL